MYLKVNEKESDKLTMSLRRKIRFIPVGVWTCFLVLASFLVVYQLLETQRPPESIQSEPKNEEFRHLLVENSPEPLYEDNNSYVDDIKRITGCHDKAADFRIDRRGQFFVLKNYIQAAQTFACHESITYTTHADFTFLDNLQPLVEHWMAPISIAIYSPGDDFQRAMESAFYLRKCGQNSELIRQFVTFHFYFEREFTPKDIVRDVRSIEERFPCVVLPPWQEDKHTDMFKVKHNLTYPVNVGRNIAREAATTYFILASDVELYPSLNVPEAFLQLYSTLTSPKPNQVFVLPIFEVEKEMDVPHNKRELQAMLKNNTAIPFHYKICPNCHEIPKQKEWIQAKSQGETRIFTTSKRQGKFHHWEPIFIGTNQEPYYEEMLNWEGKSDKMTHGYSLCLLDYDFHILSEVFLVHRPGIKTMAEARRPALERKNLDIAKKILPQLHLLYGQRKGCQY